MYNKHILITCPCNIITYKIAKMPIIRAFLLFYVSSYSVLCLHSKDIHISQIYQKPPLLPPRLLPMYHIRLSVITVHRPCPIHWLNPCPSFTIHRAVATAVSFDNSFLPGRSLPPSDVFSHASTRHSEVHLSVTSHCTSFHSFCLLIPPIQS